MQISKCANKRTMKFIFLLIIAFLPNIAGAQDWFVPEDKKQQVAPFEFTDATRNIGEDLYNKNCASCHGQPGKNNFIQLAPPPGDPASKIYQANTDGDMFFKISEGRVAMPSFKNSLDPDQRWQIISYIRSFNKDYKQPEPVSAAVSALTGKIKINIVHYNDKKELIVTVRQVDGASIKPVVGYQINLFAVRYFGNLTIDEPRTTNNNGNAVFKLPENLPGDTMGLIKFKVKVINELANISIQKDTILKAGIPAKYEKMRDKRTMWNHRSMAPLWLVVSYSLLVLGVWGTILYIMFLLKKIKESSTKTTKNE